MSCAKNSYWDLKVMQKNQIFRLIMSCTKNSYWDLKVMQKIQILRLIMSRNKNSYWDLELMQKKSDSQANQSNLLMGVVTVYKYGNRFRFAPSFNNSKQKFTVFSPFLQCQQIDFKEKSFWLKGHSSLKCF